MLNGKGTVFTYAILSLIAILSMENAHALANGKATHQLLATNIRCQAYRYPHHTICGTETEKAHYDALTMKSSLFLPANDNEAASCRGVTQIMFLSIHRPSHIRGSLAERYSAIALPQDRQVVFGTASRLPGRI